ncbi:hypothetical protein SGLAM104S_05449 [Streptomyces glaucescens]
MATLDRLSGGRVVFAAGLGGPLEDEYRAFGDTAEPRVLAERLDEGLELLERFWSGEPVRHSGQALRGPRRGRCAPPPRSGPVRPVWIGGFWPRRAPMRRAGGAVGTVRCRCSKAPGTAMRRTRTVRDLVDYVREHEQATSGRPFDFVLGGATPPAPARARDVIGLMRGGPVQESLGQGVDGDDPTLWVHHIGAGTDRVQTPREHGRRRPRLPGNPRRPCYGHDPPLLCRSSHPPGDTGTPVARCFRVPVYMPLVCRNRLILYGMRRPGHPLTPFTPATAG